MTQPAKSATRRSTAPAGAAVWPRGTRNSTVDRAAASRSSCSAAARAAGPLRASQALEAGALVQPEQRGEARGSGMEPNRPRNTARRSRRWSERPRHGALDLGPRRLHKLAVLHAGGADGLAGAAVEALVHLLAKDGGIDGRRGLRRLSDELDAAARRRGSTVQLAIGRAVRQAQAAMDTGLRMLSAGTSGGRNRARRRSGRVHDSSASRLAARRPHAAVDAPAGSGPAKRYDGSRRRGRRRAAASMAAGAEPALQMRPHVNAPRIQDQRCRGIEPRL